MYCRVIACDFDRTGWTNDHPAPELYAALGAARACGIVTLLTGRVLEDGQLIFNRGALMLLPSGINKGVGVRRALNEFGRSEHNFIARHPAGATVDRAKILAHIQDHYLIEPASVPE